MGTLYLVATPIGNLEDISQRALRILREVRWIAAEDTRQTMKLLNHFSIHTPLISFHEHSQRSKMDQILQYLDEGDLALVSDAGTPLLNDPGYLLVSAAIAAGHTIQPIPGACAPIAALIASGLRPDTFIYLGYLPRKSSDRSKFIQNIATLPYTLVLLETPHRLLEALQDIKKELGEREISIARELTKVHEEFIRGTLSEVIDHFSTKPPRGELTLVIAGYYEERKKWSREQLDTAIRDRIKQDHSPSELASQLASESGWPRRDIYRMIQKSH